MGVEDGYPIAAGTLRHVEIADHLHFDGLTLLGGWRLESEMSNIIYCGFLIFGGHDSAARDIGIHGETVFIDHETHLQLNGHAIVFLTNLEGWYKRGLLELWLTTGQDFSRIYV